MIKLAAEKNLNKFAFPVMSIKGKPVEYPFRTSFSSYEFGCDQGTLGPRQWMILDILGTYIIQKTYNNFNGEVSLSYKIPTPRDWRVKQVSEKFISYHMLRFLTGRLSNCSTGLINENFFGNGVFPQQKGQKYDRLKNPQSIIFTDSQLKKDLPFLKKYSSVQISELITQTSEVKLRMNYPIRFFDGKAYQNFQFTNYGSLSRLFSLKQVEDLDKSKTGSVLSRRYRIDFDTILGYFYVQNCISGYTDLLPGKFYELSDYAQLFYRILVLPYFDGVKSKLGIDEIQQRLVLKTQDTDMLRKTIRRILDELKDDGFLKDWSEELLYRKYAYSITKSTWKELNT